MEERRRGWTWLYHKEYIERGKFYSVVFRNRSVWAVKNNDRKLWIDLWVQPVWSLSFLTSLLPLFPHLVCPIVSVPRLGGGRFRILSPDRIIQQGEEPVPSSSSRPGLFLALDKPLPSSGPQLPSLWDEDNNNNYLLAALWGSVACVMLGKEKAVDTW